MQIPTSLHRGLREKKPPSAHCTSHATCSILGRHWTNPVSTRSARPPASPNMVHGCHRTPVSLSCYTRYLYPASTPRRASPRHRTFFSGLWAKLRGTRQPGSPVPPRHTRHYLSFSCPSSSRSMTASMVRDPTARDDSCGKIWVRGARLLYRMPAVKARHHLYLRYATFMV